MRDHETTTEKAEPTGGEATAHEARTAAGRKLAADSSARANESQTETSRVDESRAETSRANESRANESRADESRIGEPRGGEARTEQHADTASARLETAQGRSVLPEQGTPRTTDAGDPDGTAPDAQGNDRHHKIEKHDGHDGRSGNDGHGVNDEDAPALFGASDDDAYRKRWREIQGQFVDDPREAVHEADALVTDVMRSLTALFDEHKRTLEGQWSEGRDVDTESLRKALREYRSFFHRLLNT